MWSCYFFTCDLEIPDLRMWYTGSCNPSGTIPLEALPQLPYYCHEACNLQAASYNLSANLQQHRCQIRANLAELLQTCCRLIKKIVAACMFCDSCIIGLVVVMALWGYVFWVSMSYSANLARLLYANRVNPNANPRTGIILNIKCILKLIINTPPVMRGRRPNRV